MMSFINDSDPCKLICALPGQQLVKKGLVEDGTSCLTGGVCVDGDCVVSIYNISHEEEQLCYITTYTHFESFIVFQ